MSIRIAIVADFLSTSRSHIATNDAIRHSAAALALEVKTEWVHTTEVVEDSIPERLKDFDGFWIGPGSPYANMEGVISTIRWARENGIPLYGTCGGFQHSVIEYARNVIGIRDADHQETCPSATAPVISRLACSLSGRSMLLTFAPNSKLAAIYGKSQAEEEYICNFGVNPAYVETLRSGGLLAAASDSEGQIRAIEIPSHPFFIGTLFLPQHRSTAAQPHPVVSSFLNASRL